MVPELTSSSADLARPMPGSWTNDMDEPAESSRDWGGRRAGRGFGRGGRGFGRGGFGVGGFGRGGWQGWVKADHDGFHLGRGLLSADNDGMLTSTPKDPLTFPQSLGQALSKWIDEF